MAEYLDAYEARKFIEFSCSFQILIILTLLTYLLQSYFKLELLLLVIFAMAYFCPEEEEQLAKVRTVGDILDRLTRISLTLSMLEQTGDFELVKSLRNKAYELEGFVEGKDSIWSILNESGIHYSYFDGEITDQYPESAHYRSTVESLDLHLNNAFRAAIVVAVENNIDASDLEYHSQKNEIDNFTLVLPSIPSYPSAVVAGLVE